MMSKRKTFFKNQVETIYQNKTLNLSDNLNKELLETIKDIQKGDRISYLAYRLYPHVLKELNSNHSEELKAFKKYLEKKRWKYYFGSVLSMAFVRR